MDRAPAIEAGFGSERVARPFSKKLMIFRHGATLPDRYLFRHAIQPLYSRDGGTTRADATRCSMIWQTIPFWDVYRAFSEKILGFPPFIKVQRIVFRPGSLGWRDEKGVSPASCFATPPPMACLLDYEDEERVMVAG